VGQFPRDIRYGIPDAKYGQENNRPTRTKEKPANPTIMKKKIFYFVASLGLALSAVPAFASSIITSVSSVPQGMMSLSLPSGTTSNIALPLTASTVYTGTVTSVTPSTIGVSGSPFGSSLEKPGSPYFVEFLSGSEVGRIMLVTANTASTLTLDTTDNGASWTTVPLTCANFSVQAGDQFEMFPGETLASAFGTGASGSPLVLAGGTSASTADQVTLNRASCLTASTYYFNTTSGYWVQTGSTANANNTIVYPYTGITVLRPSGGSTETMTVLGQVATVGATFKMISHAWTSNSSHCAVGIKLSQLNLGAAWLKSNTSSAADMLCVWSQAQGQFLNFYEDASSNWHIIGNPSVNQNSFVITPGNVISLGDTAYTSGAQDFVADAMPYSLQ
jgi:uncharacterized protein (TIGR02597 family)